MKSYAFTQTKMVGFPKRPVDCRRRHCLLDTTIASKVIYSDFLKRTIRRFCIF